MDETNVAYILTPVGFIQLTACRRGLCCFEFMRSTPKKETGVMMEQNRHLQTGVEWIRAYFAGNFDAEQPHLCYHNCSDFQKVVYEELRKSFTGSTLSYRELSMRAVGNERSARAVGSAMRKNPYPLIVPCHRVIKSSGDLGSYSGGSGTSVKKELLSHETRFISPQ